MAKMLIGASIDPEIISKINDLYCFNGFKSRSALIESLLRDWITGISLQEQLEACRVNNRYISKEELEEIRRGN